MIKAVFFDWFNTLARYEPPREELQAQAMQEFGIHISPQKVFHSLLVADQALYEENPPEITFVCNETSFSWTVFIGYQNGSKKTN